MTKRLISINIDWADAYGWECPFCHGELDHLDEERDEEAGTADDSYTCQQQGSSMCKNAYFMSWSREHPRLYAGG